MIPTSGIFTETASDTWRRASWLEGRPQPVEDRSINRANYQNTHTKCRACIGGEQDRWRLGWMEDADKTNDAPCKPDCLYNSFGMVPGQEFLASSYNLGISFVPLMHAQVYTTSASAPVYPCIKSYEKFAFVMSSIKLNQLSVLRYWCLSTY